MAEKNTSLPHLVFLSVIALASSINKEHVSATSAKSTCDSQHFWSASAEEGDEYGLELLQLKGQQKVKSKDAANALPSKLDVSPTTPVQYLQLQVDEGEKQSERGAEQSQNTVGRSMDLQAPSETEQGYFIQTTYPDLGVVMNPTAGPSASEKENPSPQTIKCDHKLSGVGDKAVLATLDHNATTRASASSGPLQVLQQRRIFIVALLHQSESIMPMWTSELVRLLMALKGKGNAQHLFVSVYESGSMDHTAKRLQELERHLDFMNIPSKIVTGGAVRGDRQRIEFLADARNRAMAPLQESATAFDHVLWLSDNLFCADGVLQMLAHALPEAEGGLGADAVCGMDYTLKSPEPDLPSECVFYDMWVSHGIMGQNFGGFKPIVHLNLYSQAGPGNEELEQGRPFQVFSCWNAMTVFSADLFQKEKLVFRTARDQLGECAAAETELIFRDMWKIERGKIIVSPGAASAYNSNDFKHCAAKKQPTQFDYPSSIFWKPAPNMVTCCELPPGSDFVEWESCRWDEWSRFDKYEVPESKMSSFLNMDLLVSFPPAETSHASLISTSANAGGSNLVSGTLSASALVIFVGFALMHLRGLEGSIKEVKERHTNTLFVFWMSMSLLMNLLNKQCTIFLSCPFTLVMIQMLMTIFLLARTPLSGVRMEDLWRWCVLALLFGLMLVSSMFAFTFSSVTCLLILRNCQPILTLFLENAVLPNAPPVSSSIVMSLLSIAVGAYMYARFAPGYSITAHGLSWILINCLATVSHRVLERHLLTSDMRLSFEAMTLINNVVPLVPVSMLAWATGETQKWPNYFHLAHSPMAIAVITCSGILGLCLGQSSIMVQACVSATSMTVLQTLNKLFIILAAMIAFRERFTPLSCIGCAMSLIGCAAYGLAQQAAKQPSKEAVKENQPRDSASGKEVAAPQRSK